MDPEFWHERWARDEIGFHKDSYNAHMTEFLHRLALPSGSHILVPLCGKSLDLLWLHQRGYRVSGIEISSKAIEDFFGENELEYEQSEVGGMARYRHGSLELWCTDFFTADFSMMGKIDGVYDRAALVALPSPMRNDYVSCLLGALQPHTAMLVVTLDYPQEEMNGPPFSVPPCEVERLYHAHCSVDEIHAENCLASEPRFLKKGISRLHERVYLIKNKET